MKKAPNGIQRGVFVVDKAGKVLAAEPGGPAATVDVVKKLVGSSNAPAADTKKVDEVAENGKAAEEPKAEESKPATNGVNGTVTNEDIAKANVAAEVANTAEKLDSNEAPPA
jgi:thioredoxin-dependent peroxiredoxin